MIELKVEGMSCSHCENAVQKAVSALAGVTSVRAIAAQKKVTVEGGDRDAIIAAITEEGFEVIE